MFLFCFYLFFIVAFFTLLSHFLFLLFYHQSELIVVIVVFRMRLYIVFPLHNQYIGEMVEVINDCCIRSTLRGEVMLFDTIYRINTDVSAFSPS